MTIRPKRILELFAVFVSVASCASFAQNQAAVNPDVATTVTTTGGISGYLPVFTGASTVADSILFQSATGIGVGDVPNSSAVFDVNGKSIWRGLLNVSRAGTATSAAGFDSYPILLQGSVYNSATKGAVLPVFQLQVEPTGNDTATPGATFNLLASSTGGTPAETGLFFNTNGTIHFASGQTFPNGGPFCIATGGGFGSGGGTTFVGPGFTVPAENNCTPWSGFTKTASTVILTTNGAACLSSTGKTLTVSVSSVDPDYSGTTPVSDYIQLTRASSTGSFTGGSDQGEFAGSADQVTCTSSLLSLPDIHD